MRYHSAFRICRIFCDSPPFAEYLSCVHSRLESLWVTSVSVELIVAQDCRFALTASSRKDARGSSISSLETEDQSQTACKHEVHSIRQLCTRHPAAVHPVVRGYASGGQTSHQIKATGPQNKGLSNRSNRPPKPGIRLAESFFSQSRLIKDSARSPTNPTTPKVMPNRSTLVTSTVSVLA